MDWQNWRREGRLNLKNVELSHNAYVAVISPMKDCCPADLELVRVKITQNYLQKRDLASVRALTNMLKIFSLIFHTLLCDIQ